MRSGHATILSVSLEARVYQALVHYMRVRSIDKKPIPAHYGRSKAINHILRRGLRREGFDPDNLRLIGGTHQ